MSRTDDPVRDYARYDREQSEKEERLPKCSNCGDPITDEYRYNIYGNFYCEECMINNFREINED